MSNVASYRWEKDAPEPFYESKEGKAYIKRKQSKYAADRAVREKDIAMRERVATMQDKTQRDIATTKATTSTGIAQMQFNPERRLGEIGAEVTGRKDVAQMKETEATKRLGMEIGASEKALEAQYGETSLPEKEFAQETAKFNRYIAPEYERIAKKRKDVNFEDDESSVLKNILSEWDLLEGE